MLSSRLRAAFHFRCSLIAVARHVTFCHCYALSIRFQAAESCRRHTDDAADSAPSLMPILLLFFRRRCRCFAIRDSLCRRYVRAQRRNARARRERLCARDDARFMRRICSATLLRVRNAALQHAVMSGAMRRGALLPLLIVFFAAIIRCCFFR